MASVNKVIVVGHLGQDPEMRYMPSGDAVANLSVATTDKWRDKDGNMQEATEWHRISFFGRTAEVCSQYLKKGSQVYVEGSLRTRKYTDKEGIERYTTEIRGDRMQMLGGAQRGGRHDDGGYDSHQGGQQGYVNNGGGQRQATPRAPQNSGGYPARGSGGGQPRQQAPAPARQPAMAGGGGGYGPNDDDIPFGQTGQGMMHHVI